MADAAPDLQPTTPPASNETQFTAGRRAAMMAGLAAAGGATTPNPDAPPAETPAPEAKPDPAPQPDAPKPTPEPQPDESAAIRKQEIHLRRQMAEERAQLQAEYARKESEYKPKLDEYEQLKAKFAAAKDDPIAFLQAGGWTEAEFDQLARFVHAHSPEGAAKDPRAKAMAHQTKAQREQAAQLQKMQERIDAFERQQEEQRELAEMQAKVDGYYNTVTKAVTDESPIVRARLAAVPEAAKERMLAIADKLYVDSGPSDDLRDVPEPAEIIKAYEAERRADLETDLRALPIDALRALLTKLGVDPAAVLRPTGAVQPPAGPAAPTGQPRPSTTLTPNAGSPTQAPPKGRMTREQLMAEARRLNEIAKT